MTTPDPAAVALAHQLPRLVSAIEAGFKARKRPSKVRVGANGKVLTLPAMKLELALSTQLGVKPETVRQDLLKYKAGTRMPGPEKLLGLVDASVGLGYIKRNAKGTGAERLVAWCRNDVQARIAAEAAETQRALAQRRARVLSKAEKCVDELFAKGRPDFSDAVAEELLIAVPERVAFQLVEREPNLTAGSATMLRRMAAEISKLLIDVARTVEEEFAKQQADAERARESILASQLLELERVMTAVQTPQGNASLRRRALSLGIGAPQLERILKRLRTGRGLANADAKKRLELIEALRKIRPQSEWTRIGAVDKSPAPKMKTWKETKLVLDARRATKAGPK